MVGAANETSLIDTHNSEIAILHPTTGPTSTVLEGWPSPVLWGELSRETHASTQTEIVNNEQLKYN